MMRSPPEPSSTPASLEAAVARQAAAEDRAKVQRYRAFFSALDSGFCVIEVIFDAHGRPVDYVFVELNAAFERATGLRDAQGRRMRELAPDHEPHWFEIYGRVALTGEPARFEQEARALHRWFNVYAFRVEDGSTHQVGILFEDITARKKSEQRRQFLSELADQLAPLRAEADIVGAAAESLGRRLDVERCLFVECFEAENRVLVTEGYRRGATPPHPHELNLRDFGGSEWWQAALQGNLAVDDVTMHPLTRDKPDAYARLGVRSYLAQTIKEEGPRTAALAVTASTPRRWTPDEGNMVADVIARVWPLIERARTEEKLRAERAALETRVAERTATLQQTISELESFSYSISHDLRAPLRAMQTYASILVEEFGAQLGAEGQEYLRRIRVASDRMDHLIRDVLVFSRVSREKMPLERVELGSFISSVIESYPGFSDTSAQIEVVNPLAAVRANPAALTQVVANLLGNAIKFVPAGVRPKIRIWTESEGDMVSLFVRDNGRGIPAEEQERVFGMFYQTDQTAGGTGVGLAVVRKAAQRMDGAVGVESAVGQGSTFRVRLPAARGH